MAIKIALAGNPNCGKTTLFNELTGSTQYVGNWPGVTVEKKEGKLKGQKDVIIMDLPGIYSLSPYTLEEVISRNYLLDEKPEVIINIIDASNIERNLYLTTQLTEIGIPVIVALNMMDIIQKTGDKIDINRLSKEIGCGVVEISALKGMGVKEIASKAVALAKSGTRTLPQHSFSPATEFAIVKISDVICGSITDRNQLRFCSVKLFGRDQKIIDRLKLDVSVVSKIEEIVAKCEKEADDDAESIITSERYEYIETIIKGAVVKKNKTKMTASDKIDRVVTNRWLALPIFALVMWLVYFIAVTSVGTIATDWANDGVFGDGWHLFGIGASQYEESMGVYEGEQAKIEAFIAAADEKGINTEGIKAALEPEEEATEEEAIKEETAPDTEASTETETGAVETAFDREAAISIFISEAKEVTAEVEGEEGIEPTIVSLTDFEAALKVPEPDPATMGIWVPGIPVIVEGWMTAAQAPEWLSGLVLDGIVGGVGAVLGFVPQMLILFLFLAFLEDCGYMARVAFIMDRVFRKFGLSGKSFIPILISSGCGVPGIMASRTIENDKDRRMTIMLTTFIPCGAKLPVIALIAGAIFPGSTWVAPFTYFLGVLVIILSGIILKKTKLFSGEPAPFVMELPQYHTPGIKGLFTHMWERGSSFIVKAGTIIFVACGLVWFLSSFGFGESGFGMVSEESSILAAMGNAIAWIFTPLGFGDWKSAVATISGLVAKENVVGTFGVLFGAADATESDPMLLANVGAAFTAVSGLSFLVFNLLCAPCFAAIGAVKREMGSWKWMWISVGYQTLLAYIVAFIIYQLGAVFVLGQGFGIGSVIAIALIGVILWLLFRSNKASSLTQKKVSERETVSV